MGYSNSEASIKRVQKLLDQMLDAQSDISWPSPNAHMLGYHIREALTIAKKKGIEPYKGLKDRFIIRNKGTRVVAELRDVETLAALQSAMSKVVLENLSSLMEILGGAINHKMSEMFFPDADLTQDEAEKLYLWAQKNGYFLIVAESGITLTKNDPGEAVFRPESS